MSKLIFRSSLRHQKLFASPVAASQVRFSHDNAKIKPVPNAFVTKIKNYGELSKFRLSSLVVFTSGAGFALAGAPIDICTMAAACFGTALCAASAGTFNQIIEKDRDAKMNRTCMRPLPSGKVTVAEASIWGFSTAAVGTGLLLAGTNPTVAALGAFNIFLYSVPYTYSKQHSEVNTWIGSVVGAIPPVMGWAAATGGSLVAAEPLAIGTALFLWQFPHFFALSWLHRQDYAKGDFQMVAVNDPQGIRSAELIWDYSLLLTALPILTSATGLTSWMFAVEGTVINVYLLSLARAFRQEQTNARARKVFLTSLWYLPVLLVAMVFHSRNWNKDKIESANKIENGSGDAITVAVSDARETLKSLCPHELLSGNEIVVNSSSKISPTGELTEATTGSTAAGKHSHLCVKLKADAAIDAGSELITDTVQEVVHSAAIVVLPQNSKTM